MFLDQNRQKPWYTTASNQISVSDITVIEEWLLSGGSYSTYTEPARFLKLLLDDETGRTLSAMLLSKCPSDTHHIGIKNIVDILNELISSRKQ